MGLNWYGTYSLYKREIGRFLATFQQTILGPIVSASTFFLILALATEGNRANVPIPFPEFVFCGLIAQNVIQAAFLGPSTSLLTSKVVGYIHDIVFPPFGSTEILIAYIASGVTRALVVGLAIVLLFSPFVSLHCTHPLLLAYFACATSITSSGIGVVVGILARDFERGASISLNIITPLSLLSCTFYSARSLPPPLLSITQCNPFFYMIDGIRYGITGYSETSVLLGAAFLGILAVFSLLIAAALLNRGYGMKS